MEVSNPPLWTRKGREVNEGKTKRNMDLLFWLISAGLVIMLLFIALGKIHPSK